MVITVLEMVDIAVPKFMDIAVPKFMDTTVLNVIQIITVNNSIVIESECCFKTTELLLCLNLNK